VTPYESLSDEAKVGLDDLFFFGINYWGLQLEEKPHRWMCDELMKTLTDEGTPHLLMDVPRGCYKTSLVTAGAVLAYLRQVYYYDNPYHRIVYASAKLALGEAFLTLMENVLKAGGHEGRIDRDYGKLWREPTRNNRKSSHQKDGIVLAPRMERGEIASVRDPNFFIASLRKPRVGFHADGAILDDLNDDLNTETAEQLKKTQDFYRQVYPIIDAKDRAGNASHIWMTCTPYKDDDVRGMIIREEAEKQVEHADYVSPWRVVKATAHMPDGTLFFPTKLSEAKLASLKESMKSKYYAAYEGEPVTESDRLATDEEIRYKGYEDFPPLRWCRITVDPNQHNDARKLGCYSAIVMGGYDKFAKIWITDIRASRDWDSSGLIDALYRAQEEHPTWPIFVEDSHMTHFDHAVNLEFVRRVSEEERKSREDATYQPKTIHRLRINWVSPHKGGSKYEKWAGLKPRFQNASIFFAQTIAPSIKSELENELTRGRAARYKDILDALAMMENGVTPRMNAAAKMEVIPDKTDVGGKAEGGGKVSFASAFPGMVA
jgi:hypothetical protein